MAVHADEGTSEQGKAFKRRGILAAAGVVVAGLMAKQIAEESPVTANDAVWTLPYTGTISDVTPAFSMTNNGTGQGVAGTSAGGTGVLGRSSASSSSYGVYGSSSSGGTGVQGVSGGDTSENTTGFPIGVRGSVLDTGFGVYGNAGNGSGVYGIATGGVGVYGTSGGNGVVGLTTAPANSGYAAIYGGSNGVGNIGVFGDGAGGVGVQGQSNAAGGTGVQGVSGSGFPIIGKVTGTGSATNTAAGVLGAGTKGPGVQGQSTGGHGLVGTTDASDGHAGLVGNANKAGGVGLIGIAPGYGTMTVGQAGIFYGNVKITGGTLSAPVMQAVVPHAGDGTYRALHTVASPESWFEDFGEAKLVNGTADVKLDSDFAALIETTGYQVFLTEYDDHNSLFVRKRSASGFVVQAKETVNAVGVKTPTKAVSGTFGYRVVAKRKDIAGERLAKVAAPEAPKVPTTFAIPETSEIKPPTKKP